MEEEVAKNLAEEFPGEVPEQLLPFEIKNIATIQTLEELIEVEVQKEVRDIGKPLALDLLKLRDGKVLTIEELKKFYNTRINKNSRLPISKLIMCWLSLKLVENNVASTEWHDALLETLFLIKDYEIFNIHAFIRKMIANSLVKVGHAATTFEEKIQEHLFINKVKTILDGLGREEGTIELELHYFELAVKSAIFEKMKAAETIQEAVTLTKEAEKIGVDVEEFKEAVCSFVGLWWKAGNITENQYQILCDILRKPEEKIDLTKFVKKTEKDPPEDDVPDIIVEEEVVLKDIADLEKVNVRHMGTQEKAEVTVFECKIRGKDTTDRIALKQCRARNPSDLECFIEESKILKKLSGCSVNFVKYYCDSLNFEEKNEEKIQIFSMAMEYVENTLAKYKDKRNHLGKPFTETEFISYFKQLISAFNILATKGIAHCDIKPSNLLITNDGIIKVIDFNSSKMISDRTVLGSAAGTLDFMAPEIRRAMIDPSQQGKFKQDKMDVFSLGMTFLYLITQEPIAGLNLDQNRNKLLELINRTPFEGFRLVLKNMLEFDYNKRPSLHDLAEIIPRDESETVDITSG